jgi:hypothetical protein
VERPNDRENENFDTSHGCDTLTHRVFVIAIVVDTALVLHRSIVLHVGSWLFVIHIDMKG